MNQHIINCFNRRKHRMAAARIHCVGAVWIRRLRLFFYARGTILWKAEAERRQRLPFIHLSFGWLLPRLVISSRGVLFSVIASSSPF